MWDFLLGTPLTPLCVGSMFLEADNPHVNHACKYDVDSGIKDYAFQTVL